METGREEVEQRKREKGLAEKWRWEMEEKGVGKEVEVGNGRERMRTGGKKGRRM